MICKANRLHTSFTTTWRLGTSLGFRAVVAEPIQLRGQVIIGPDDFGECRVADLQPVPAGS